MKILLISDFTTGMLKSKLANDKSQPLVEAEEGPFGMVFELLIDPNHVCWASKPDVAFIWTQPQAIISSFARLLSFENVSPEEILEEVDAFSAHIVEASKRVTTTFVSTWTLPFYERGLGMIDLTHEKGIGASLSRMNARLIDNLRQHKSIFVLDAQRWMSAAGKTAFSPQMWYMTKSPFSLNVYDEAVADIKAALRGLAGQSKKLIILDLDDTLWGGIVGDVGWKELRLGGHDPVGEAFIDFQKALKALTKRGIILSIVSKNEELVALNAMRSHPDMVLKESDFAGWRINWNDKAQNIVELVKELNLVLSSVVFIDDNPAERERIRQSLPEVFVPEWPKDKMLYKQSLAELRCFDSPSISKEDEDRVKMYVAEKQRRDLAQGPVSPEEFLKSLEVKLTIETLSEANLSRASQLLNKTNQMNLSTRRMTDSELWGWAQKNKVWTVRVSDKFGDSGLTGLVSVTIEGETARIVDFVLSCRVFGRQVEEAMIYTAMGYAMDREVKSIVAEYIPTEKNKPTLAFFDKTQFKKNGNVYTRTTGQPYFFSFVVKLEEK